MAMVRKSLKAIKAAKPKMDQAKIAATSEADIRRHMREDSERPGRAPRIAEMITSPGGGKRPK